MNYYKRHIGDYIKDTAHLSLLEHGIYTRLLDVYYGREGPIPDDEAARLIGARTSAERAALKTTLTEFFKQVDGAWSHTRCEREIGKLSDSAEISRTVGKLGGRPRKVQTHQVQENNPAGSETETHQVSENNPSHKPVTSNHKPVTKENNNAASLLADIDPQIVADWTALRKQKRAPVTATAIDGIRAEALKANLSLQEALALCCQRGWTGFEADWLRDQKSANGAKGMTPYQQMQVEKHAESKRFHAAISGKASHEREPIDVTPDPAERLD